MLDGTPAVNWLGTKLEEIPPILLILSSEVIPVRVFWLHRTKLWSKKKTHDHDWHNCHVTVVGKCAGYFTWKMPKTVQSL
jgi:hypothetical protein